MLKRKATRWWPRWATGSALVLALGVPTTAFAGDDPAPAQPSEPSRCVQICEGQSGTQARDVQERTCQAASSDQAQSGYQLGASPSSPVMPPDDHPYTQAHYQLGAGHQD